MHNTHQLTTINLKLYGLIGYPLSHSFSGEYFKHKFITEKITDCEYKLFPIESISQLPEIIKNNPELIGLNVTIPYKEQVIKYINVLDEIAGEINAVNTIKIIRDSSGTYKLNGYNTDTHGFSQTLKPLLKPHHNKAFILGTGGASKAVAFVLKQEGIEFSFVSRANVSSRYIGMKHFRYDELNKDIIASHQLIINTTPLGMYPSINDYPKIPYEYITEKHLLIDLIYNPDETVFLRKGKEQGAYTANGLRMLQLQADKAWEIWNE